MDNREKIAKIADTYGYDAQSRQCIEEMAELTQAINKLWRAERNTDAICAIRKNETFWKKWQMCRL